VTGLRAMLRFSQIVNVYLEHADKQVLSERKKEWKGLLKAFRLLDKEAQGHITPARYVVIRHVALSRSRILRNHTPTARACTRTCTRPPNSTSPVSPSFACVYTLFNLSAIAD